MMLLGANLILILTPMGPGCKHQTNISVEIDRHASSWKDCHYRDVVVMKLLK